MPVASATPTPTGTTSPSPDTPSAIAILAVQPHDPTQPELFEYVLLENLQPALQNLAGWSLKHASTGEVYTLPVLTVPAEGLVAIWSGDGVDDPETGTLYWPADQGRWSAGDTAELRSPDGQLVSTLIVSPEPDSSSEGTSP
ncbi:MAG TPA: lamin tail domain-containing protein [Chloroflexaceae bacterium]|nr:lamin tail domain-containing protein [Chloroflexaceae bacterium]